MPERTTSPWPILVSRLLAPGTRSLIVPTMVSMPADRPFWMVCVPLAAMLVGPDSCTGPVHTDEPLTARRPPELAGTSDRKNWYMLRP